MKQFCRQLCDGFCTAYLGRTEPVKACSDVLSRLPSDVVTGTAKVLVIAAILENVIFDLRGKSGRLHHNSEEEAVLARFGKCLTFMPAEKPRIIGFLKHQ